MFFYFKKITAHGIENIPKDRPILFVSNHRNGLMDPILIAITSGRIHYFLTRASAFKNPIANVLLRSIKMLPIYRVRDGFSSIQKNNIIFELCYQAFNQNNTVLVFPEGNHGLPRRLRRLSKGFTRIAFGYIEKNSKNNLVIVPVGINYSDMHEKGSSVAVYYGKPIEIFDFYKPKEANKAINLLIAKVSDSIKKLSTHIDDLENHDRIEQVLSQQGISFLDPEKANEMISQTIDWNILAQTTEQKKSLYQRILRVIFIINTLLPVLLWNSIKNKIKDPALIPTFRFGLSLGLLPVYYFLQSMLISFFSNPYWGFVYFIASILLLLIYRNSIHITRLTTNPS